MDIIKQPILDVNALKIQGEELNEKTIKGTWLPELIPSGEIPTFDSVSIGG